MSSIILGELRRKKIELENKLRSLREKEKALQERAKLLEAQVGGLEERLKPQKYPKISEIQERLIAQQQQEELKVMEARAASRDGVKLNRTRLSSNVVFSWGYYKKPP